MDKPPGKTQPPATGYRYNCVNKSILEPVVIKYYASHFFKWIPRKLTANWITLISCGLMWLLLFLAHQAGHFSTATLTLAFVFIIHFYMLGDILDGMQAKHTGTSSPLGEFLDHYLDIYNSAICLAGFYVLVQLDNPGIYYFMLWLSYAAFAATMVEEKERGQLYFGPIGSFEGLILILIFFLSWLIPTVQTFWKTPAWQDYPAYWLIIIMGLMGFAGTVRDAIKRIGYSPRQFIVFCVGSLFLSLALMKTPASLWEGWFLLAFYSGDYTGRVMESYHLKQKHPYPDYFLTGAAFFLFADSLLHILSATECLNLIHILTLYMAIACLWNLIKTLKSLWHHWLWVNP